MKKNIDVWCLLKYKQTKRNWGYARISGSLYTFWGSASRGFKFRLKENIDECTYLKKKALATGQFRDLSEGNKKNAHFRDSLGESFCLAVLSE